jgi:hypothetical protein
MSFRWFIYYCALCGGWSAFLGWVLGRILSPQREILAAGVTGMFVGILIALGLGLLDVAWNLSRHRLGQGVLRVTVGVLVGGMGGYFGATVGQALFGLTGDATKWSVLHIFGLLFRTAGWTITGLLIGTSIGAFEMIVSLLRGESTHWAKRKIMKGLLGGTLGGLLGGLFMILQR